MRSLRTVALVLLLGLIGTACGARLNPELRKEAADAVLTGGGVQPSTGPGSLSQGNTLPGQTQTSGGSKGTQGTQGTQGTHASQGTHNSGQSGGSNGCQSTTTDVGLTSNHIELGNVSSTSGPVSGLFEGAVEGAQAFAAYANSIGGLCGHGVSFQIADDSTNCPNNENDTQQLASKVFAFVGSFSLYDGCGAKYLAAHHDVPDIHVALQPDADTPPNHFDVETGHLGYATGMFAYYAHKLGSAVQSVGTLYANVGGAVPKQHAFVNSATREGWKFVYSRGTDATETDFTSDFVKMCNQYHIKIFFTAATNASEAATMVHDESQAGCPKSLINIIPIAYDQAFVADVGNTSAIEGLLGWNEYSLFFNADEAARIPEVKLFQQWFARAYPGKPANLYALFAWASGRLFQQAFEAAAPTINRSTLMAQLGKIKNFTDYGAMAPMTPSDKKGGVKCYVLWQFHSGKFERVDDPTTGYRCDGEFLPYNGS